MTSLENFSSRVKIVLSLSIFYLRNMDSLEKCDLRSLLAFVKHANKHTVKSSWFMIVEVVSSEVGRGNRSARFPERVAHLTTRKYTLSRESSFRMHRHRLER